MHTTISGPASIVRLAAGMNSGPRRITALRNVVTIQNLTDSARQQDSQRGPRHSSAFAHWRCAQVVAFALLGVELF
jgi:hypothetical protein